MPAGRLTFIYPPANRVLRCGGAQVEALGHVNPYGRFRLDMDTRLDLAAA
jgi:hypothetical protein